MIQVSVYFRRGIGRRVDDLLKQLVELSIPRRLLGFGFFSSSTLSFSSCSFITPEPLTRLASRSKDLRYTEIKHCIYSTSHRRTPLFDVTHSTIPITSSS
jgi:hypothetical protein